MELYNAEEAADMVLNMTSDLSSIESEDDGEHSDIVSDVYENTDLAINEVSTSTSFATVASPLHSLNETFIINSDQSTNEPN